MLYPVKSYSDLKFGSLVDTLQDPWHYRVRAQTGQTGVSGLKLNEIECLICTFYLHVCVNLSQQTFH